MPNPTLIIPTNDPATAKPSISSSTSPSTSSSAPKARQTEVIWNSDTRYPGPKVFHPPEEIGGLPTQEELDGFPRMFSWGELKEILQSRDLEQLMRNKALQQRYDEWMAGMKVVYGSTEYYLKNVRLPWNRSGPVEPTYDLSTSLDKPKASADSTKSKTDQDVSPPQPDGDVSTANLTPATSPKSIKTNANLSKLNIQSTPYLSTPTPGRGSAPVSGTSTPSSAGFVSLASLKLVNGKLRSARSTPRPADTPATISSDDDDDEDAEDPIYLKWDDSKGLDEANFAVLPNDWPYNIPYGVRHYCVWCRIPIAHPELVNYDPALWAGIEEQGLLGFTGVTPVLDLAFPPSPTSPASANPSHQVNTTDSAGRAKFIKKLERHQWYSADVAYGGQEAKKWAGVEVESPGGKEVGRMVKGLWDERGWECLWFVNPPRLQSVPGFSHFHVFARRKTPEEIDAAEVAFAKPKQADKEPVTP
ncbi:hypothetical protein BCR39DRAFT_530056 [Naematelia encephala]|uniref:Uncharacterized protein n=1 Tax=Naematelia encephala TaxID=71784 RepID=A0A1Y2B6Y1_9TREE|nr:hypothetical protein BCR39DRAFT_530056 [Naematelia encephala]